MERLLWCFNIFGIEFGWAIDRNIKEFGFFGHDSEYCITYIGKFRIWNHYRYYKKEND